MSGKRLLPKAFKSENHISEVKGIYVPFWLYDTDASADIRYKATKTRFWSDNDYDYTETSYYAVHRSGSLGFDHVPVDGSASMENDLMESIEPFDFKEAVDFQTAYLAGYFADKYDVTAEECEDVPMSVSVTVRKMHSGIRSEAIPVWFRRIPASGFITELRSMHCIRYGSCRRNGKAIITYLP